MTTPAERPEDRSHLDALVRPALERALAVAREMAADPTGPAPPTALRPLLGFQRLRGPALGTIRRALDDDGFRAAVADGATAEDLGRGGWLFLVRPEGWEAELAARVDEEAARVAQRGEREAEAELRQLRERFDDQQAVVGSLRRELDAARGEVARVVTELEGVRSELAGARADSERALEDRREAVRALKRTEARLAARTAELREARERQTRGDADGAAEGATGGAGGAGLPASPAGVDLPDAADLGRRVAELEDHAAHLAGAAAALRDLLGPLLGEVASPGTGPRERPGTGPRRRRRWRPGRGLVEGSPEATEELLRLPGLEVLVDGYNVTMGAWPGLAAAEQRRSLEQAVGALVARCGTAVTLVFDGVDDGGRPARSAPSPVRVRFTAGDTEADDEILDLVAALAPTVPVLVVSDDRRVVTGAAELGANTLGGAAFVAALSP